MSAPRLPVCKYCDRKFTPDVRSRDRQRVCGRPECRRAASCAKKRRYYHRRIEREKGFREKERVRCRAAMRELRRRRAEHSPPRSPPCLYELMAGLVSLLGGTSDPKDVATMMSMHADRGRRLALAVPVRGSPG